MWDNVFYLLDAGTFLTHPRRVGTVLWYPFLAFILARHVLYIFGTLKTENNI